jgi:hypothetical protein
MLKFDDYGYLTPYEPIPSTLEDIERHLTYNIRRQTLFSALSKFIDELKKLDVYPIIMWVNGSFTTTKKYPKDIDLVVFLPFDKLKSNTKDLQILAKSNDPLIEVFYEPIYPSGHQLDVTNVENQSYWQGVFGFDRKGFDKGIIELNF